MGDRVCVDLSCLLKPGEGLLVSDFFPDINKCSYNPDPPLDAKFAICSFISVVIRWDHLHELCFSCIRSAWSHLMSAVDHSE